MTNILFIHGFNGSSAGNTYNVLKDNLDPTKYTLFTVDYNEYDAGDAIRKVKIFCNDNKIDLIFGTSLGGFIAMNIVGVPRIVHNPCYLPSVELPNIGMSIDCANTYINYERLIDEYYDTEERMITFGVFSNNDELLGDKYKDIFDKHSNKCITIDGNHKLTVETIKNDIVEFIDEIVDYINNILYKQVKQ